MTIYSNQTHGTKHLDMSVPHCCADRHWHPFAKRAPARSLVARWRSILLDSCTSTPCAPACSCLNHESTRLAHTRW